MMNGSSIDYQLYSTVNLCCSKFAYFHWVGGWLGGQNLIIKTISAEMDWAELGDLRDEIAYQYFYSLYYLIKKALANKAMNHIYVWA